MKSLKWLPRSKSSGVTPWRFNGLNLVEKLAQELQEKNAAIEQALADLREAQDQIIASQKLAELGELTAGVAHEIKNPLNFVKNFAEASSELIEELKETLDESGDSMDEEQRGLIDEICQDLVENFERIRGHGDRADRIVRDMLRMGRSSAGERQPTDINTLLEEHVRLAFHSARANDENFQLDIQEDFDPDAGEIDVVPQDLGRVFLNMVGNACDATNERRMSSDDNYSPILAVSTKRMEDAVEIRVRDNGTGMPQEVVDKIFNPFFTTKPTDRGQRSRPRHLERYRAPAWRHDSRRLGAGEPHRNDHRHPPRPARARSPGRGVRSGAGRSRLAACRPCPAGGKPDGGDRRAWAGAKHGAREAATGFVALAACVRRFLRRDRLPVSSRVRDTGRGGPRSGSPLRSPARPLR